MINLKREQSLLKNKMEIDIGSESKQELLSEWDKDIKVKAEEFDNYVEA